MLAQTHRYWPVANGVVLVVMTGVGIMLLSRFASRPLLLIGQISSTCTLLAIWLYRKPSMVITTYCVAIRLWPGC